MWVLKYTGQFKKDLKRYQNKPKKIESLMRILTLLKETGSVPDDYYPHMLKGDYSAHLQSSVFKLSKDLIDSIHEEGIVAYTS